jgi:hypothetical protein
MTAGDAAEAGPSTSQPATTEVVNGSVPSYSLADADELLKVISIIGPPSSNLKCALPSKLAFLWTRPSPTQAFFSELKDVDRDNEVNR